MYKPEGYYVIKGKFTWAQLDEILGKAAYGLQRGQCVVGEPEPCGLSPSSDGLTYKIYCDWVDGIGSRSAHVVLHPDGVCFSGSLRIEQDWTFAKGLFGKVRTRFGKYQKVFVEVHDG